MSNESETDYKALAAKAISQPLVTHIYTADPSAHVFEGRIYIYPSHDIEAGIPFNDDGDHFGMEDYHVLRMDSPTSQAVDCGVALHIKDVPWARSPDVGAGCGDEGWQVLPVFPGQAGRRRSSRSASRWATVPLARSSRSPKQSPAATRSTRRCSPTTMALTTCISAASGAGSCRSIATTPTALPMKSRPTTNRR